VTIALYPGSFDPVTNGHLDIARRALRLFDHLVVAVYDAPPKKLMFSTTERVEMFARAVADWGNVEVIAYSGLTVDAARRAGAHFIVRGLRANQDFENEFEMAAMNARLAPDIDKAYLFAGSDYQFVSSSLLKEVKSLGGDISPFVPAHVLAAMDERMAVHA
jgi:pantetheine-phosphate adenylyltransferase